MTVIVTRDVAARFRGFLASCMLEISPGVYSSPRLNPSVRNRIWKVLSGWYGETGGGSITMLWLDPGSRAGQSILSLGTPPIDLYEYDGVILSLKSLERG